MRNHPVIATLILCLALCASPLVAQEEEAEPGDFHPQALPSAALPFVAINPCRLADTRNSTFPAGYGPPALTSGVVRVFTFPARCGIPAAVSAVSANLTVVNTKGAGFIATYPAGTASPSPLVSSLNYSGANQVVANAVVISLGSAGQANILAGVSGTDLIIDVNGYYPSTGLVTSVNSLLGAVNLAAGANVTLTPSGNTVTIATSVPSGPAGPAGPPGATGPTGATGPPGIVTRAAPPCFNTSSRYVDCGNGTVTDTVTGLIWLKNANCFGVLDYQVANQTTLALANGQCGLTDASSAGDWRLPTKSEWEATVARAVVLVCNSPSLTDGFGGSCASVGGTPFAGVQSWYWTLNAFDQVPSSGWCVGLGNSGVLDVCRKDAQGTTIFVWPVRGGR